MGFGYILSLALVAYGAGQSVAQHYSNATHTAQGSHSTSTSTLFLTSTKYLEPTRTASFSTTTVFPLSTYVSLVTDLEGFSNDNPMNISTTLTPKVSGITYSWVQAITPTILGKVYVIINNLGQTTSSTSTNSTALASNTMYLQNGTLSLLTRTDVNKAGTVTSVIPTGVGASTVVTYPTPYFTVPGPIYWSGMTPTISSGITCCFNFRTSSPIPQNHYPFPSATGSTDSRDPSGWLYSLTTYSSTYTGSRNISSILAPATINSVLNYCPFRTCDVMQTSVDAVFVDPAADLLTTTVHVTVSSSSTVQTTKTVKAMPAAVTASTSPRTASSVLVDPMTASVDGATGTPSSTPPSSSGDSTEQTVLTHGSTISAESEVESSTQQAGSASPTAASLGPTVQEHTSDTSQDISSSAISVPTSQDSNAAKSSQGASTPSSILVTQILSAASQSAAFTQPGPGDQSPTRATSPIVSIPVGSTSVAVSQISLTTTISDRSGVSRGAVIGSQTVPIGSTVSVGNTPVAVVTSNSQTYAVVGDSTSLLQQILSSASIAFPGPMTVGSTTVTPNPASQYIVGSQTLSPGGPAVTVSGIPYSLAPSATEVVIGTSTEVLTSGTGLASYVSSAIGGTQGTSAGQTANTGASSLPSRSSNTSTSPTTSTSPNTGVSTTNGLAGSQSTVAQASDATSGRAGYTGLTTLLSLAVSLIFYSSV